MRLFRALFAPSEPMRALSAYDGDVSLPFEIRPIKSPAELAEVGAMRHSSYRLLSNPLHAIDDLDFASHAIVLGAFDKKSHKLLGTMRILLSSRGPSEIARYIDLPEAWSNTPFGEARHLCVPRLSRHHLSVKVMLFKSLYLLAHDQNCDSLVIATRGALQGMYRMMHFVDLQESSTKFVPDGTHHEQTVLGLPMSGLAQRWNDDPEMVAFHRLFFKQNHPDLSLPSGASLNPLTGAYIKQQWKETLASSPFREAA